jgi:hypothetical protein
MLPVLIFTQSLQRQFGSITSELGKYAEELPVVIPDRLMSFEADTPEGMGATTPVTF